MRPVVLWFCRFHNQDSSLNKPNPPNPSPPPPPPRENGALQGKKTCSRHFLCRVGATGLFNYSKWKSCSVLIIIKLECISSDLPYMVLLIWTGNGGSLYNAYCRNTKYCNRGPDRSLAQPTLKKKSRTHVIKLDIAPKSFPPGQYLVSFCLQQHALLSQSMR
jgi:hypothetical protein